MIGSTTLYGLCATGLVAIGLYGLVLHPSPLRKVIAFNLLGSGTFILFGVAAQRGAAAGLLADPVPQAMVITGIVVAFAATAMAVALLLRLVESGGSTLEPSAPDPQDDRPS